MILTVCERGTVRSVTAAQILKDVAGLKDVIAVGVATTTPVTMLTLCEMADTILFCGHNGLLDTWLPALPESCQQKVTHLHIGVDHWLRPLHPDLVHTIGQALSQYTHLLDTPQGHYSSFEAYEAANRGTNG